MQHPSPKPESPTVLPTPTHDTTMTRGENTLYWEDNIKHRMNQIPKYKTTPLGNPGPLAWVGTASWHRWAESFVLLLDYNTQPFQPWQVVPDEACPLPFWSNLLASQRGKAGNPTSWSGPLLTERVHKVLLQCSRCAGGAHERRQVARCRPKTEAPKQSEQKKRPLWAWDPHPQRMEKSSELEKLRVTGICTHQKWKDSFKQRCHF